MAYSTSPSGEDGAVAVPTLHVSTGGIGGQTLWGPLPDAPETYILWPGVGAPPLYLSIRPYSPSGAMIPIEHPTARDSYPDRKSAARAVAAFVAAAEDGAR